MSAVPSTGQDLYCNAELVVSPLAVAVTTSRLITQEAQLSLTNSPSLVVFCIMCCPLVK